MTKILWQHKYPHGIEAHSVEPHYNSAGHWVCYVCRVPITDGGKTVNMTALPDGRVLTADPDQPGLDTEGS